MDQGLPYDTAYQGKRHAGEKARADGTPERPGPQISYHTDQSIANSDQRTDSGQNVARGQVPEEQGRG